MNFSGTLTKMHTELRKPVAYYLDLDKDLIHVNEWIGKEIHLEFIKYRCLSCGAEKKIFRGGYCYDCFSKLPQAAEWVIRPELSKAHLGEEDRDLEYERKVQLQPHYVYLANTGSVKVGVTRQNQIPTRWIDQGAHEAMIIMETPNRYLAGIAEVALKKHISDKTNRKLMLTQPETPSDLPEIKENLIRELPVEVQDYILPVNEVVHIQYPIEELPHKIKALKLDETGNFTGLLKGIKGQYWIFSGGIVWNVRNHEGHYVNIRV